LALFEDKFLLEQRVCDGKGGGGALGLPEERVEDGDVSDFFDDKFLPEGFVKGSGELALLEMFLWSSRCKEEFPAGAVGLLRQFATSFYKSFWQELIIKKIRHIAIFNSFFRQT
jgi:hypothetical protein